MWTYELCDTVTGERITPLVVEDARWTIRMGAQIGEGQVVIPTREKFYEKWTTSMWTSVRKSWARVVVGKFNEQPVWAMLVGGRPKYNYSTGRLTLPLAEIGALLQRRLFFGAGLLGQSQSFGPYTRKGMFDAVARHVCGGGAGSPVGGSNSPWRLPVWIDLPAAGGWNRTTYQHQMERPWEWMVDIAETGGGLDFVFAPGFWSGGGSGGEMPTHFQWVLNSGASLERSVHEYVIGAPSSPVVDPETTWDASDQMTGMFALGEGYGADRPIGMATPSDSVVMPAMDVAFTSLRKSTLSALNEDATAKLARFRHPIETTPFSIRADAILSGMHGTDMDGLRPGSQVILHRDDVVTGRGTVEGPVVALSGTHRSQIVDVEVESA